MYQLHEVHENCNRKYRYVFSLVVASTTLQALHVELCLFKSNCNILALLFIATVKRNAKGPEGED